MTETTTTLDQPRPKRSNGSRREKALGPELVSGNRLARHFGVVRQHVDRLAPQGVIERRPDGLFDQDQSRLKYFTHLRSEHRRSPRSTADAEHTRVKTEMLQLRLMEKRGQLCLQSDVDEPVRKIVGATLTWLSGLAARCAPPGDLVTRRNIERGVFELRKELAAIGEQMADERGEPPLAEQLRK